MVKLKFIGVVLLLAIFFLNFTTALSSEEKTLVNICKKECNLNLVPSLKLCGQVYSECTNDCSQKIKECKIENENLFNLCSENCSMTFNESSRNIRKCNTFCKKTFNAKKLCNSENCKKICSDSKIECTYFAREKYNDCRKNCIYAAFNNNITCENGKYNAGDIFLDGCEICECKYSSSIECKKSLTCNFDNFSITKQYCEESNGLYQQLCMGPYFRLRCSREHYCQCDGFYDYRCPENYICVKDFKVSIPPTLGGYNNRQGQSLGDIGICAKKPLLEKCGNGICENIVCIKTEEGCAQAETSFNCPQDC